MGKTRLKKAKNEELTLREVFGDFINSQEAKGVAAQTRFMLPPRFISASPAPLSPFSYPLRLNADVPLRHSGGAVL